PKLTEASLRFPLKITYRVLDGQKYKASAQLLISIKRDSGFANNLAIFDYGAVVMIPADYSTINPPFNPNEFDFRAYLANHGIWHRAYLTFDNVIPLGFYNGNTLIASALHCREKLINRLNHSLESNRVVAIVSALVLGYRNQLE